MRSKLALAIVVVGLALTASAEAWATEQDTFLSVLRRVGLTDSVFTSKKPCLCTVGTQDGSVGRVVASKVGSHFEFDCVIQFFDLDGGQAGTASCVLNGGSMTVVP